MKRVNHWNIKLRYIRITKITFFSGQIFTSCFQFISRRKKRVIKKGKKVYYFNVKYDMINMVIKLIF